MAIQLIDKKAEDGRLAAVAHGPNPQRIEITREVRFELRQVRLRMGRAEGTHEEGFAVFVAGHSIAPNRDA